MEMNKATDVINKLLANKKKLENIEAENNRLKTRYETLLEQAKTKYGITTIAELESYRDRELEKYTTAMQEVEQYNTTLNAYFAEVE